MSSRLENYLALPELDNGEVVYRALKPPYWNSEKNRGTSKAFSGQEISVSREKILPYAETVKLFQSKIKGVQALCSITVAEILECASRQQAIVLKVIEKRSTNNPAHAEIVGFKEDFSYFLDIPQSVGAKIIKKATLHTFGENLSSL